MNTVRAGVRVGHSGVVLPMCLSFLVLTGLLAVSLSRGTLLQLQMAGYQSAQQQALAHAQSLVTALLLDPQNFDPLQIPGKERCASAAAGTACTRFDLSLGGGESVPATGSSLYGVARMMPLQREVPLIGSDGQPTGEAITIAQFEVWARFDGTAIGQGRAEVVQGVALKLARGPALRVGVATPLGTGRSQLSRFPDQGLWRSHWRSSSVEQP